MDGFLILDKPRGLTSQQALNRVRRALNVKKLGHTGTLDPLATGVLPIALGEATKIIPYLEEETKAYLVTGRLGETTDSYDSDGKTVRRADPAWVDRGTLESTIQKFLGHQEQVPPVYSAIKLQGRPLYSYARGGEGDGVVLKPRQVHFIDLELEGFVSPDFVLRVDCSKGTYVRSLIHDIGQKLGCGAHVTQLRRLQSGPFDLERAISLDRVIEDPSAAAGRILGIEALLEDWPKIELLDAEEIRRTRAGVSLRRINQVIENTSLFGKRLALVQGPVIHALIEAVSGKDFEYLRVFHREELV